MTTEPRQEAEEIVGEYEARVIEATHGSGAAAWTDSQARLVDALAAVFEHDDAERVLADVNESTDMEAIQHAEFRWARAEKARRRALSALREDETWHAS